MRIKYGTLLSLLLWISLFLSIGLQAPLYISIPIAMMTIFSTIVILRRFGRTVKVTVFLALVVLVALLLWLRNY